jgi:hypothetical protein
MSWVLLVGQGVLCVIQAFFAFVTWRCYRQWKMWAEEARRQVRNDLR